MTSGRAVNLVAIVYVKTVTPARPLKHSVIMLSTIPLKGKGSICYTRETALICFANSLTAYFRFHTQPLRSFQLASPSTFSVAHNPDFRIHLESEKYIDFLIDFVFQYLRFCQA